MAKKNTIDKIKNMFSESGIKEDDYFIPTWNPLRLEEIKILEEHGIPLDLLTQEKLQFIGFTSLNRADGKDVTTALVQKSDSNFNYFLPLEVLKSVEWVQGPYFYTYEEDLDEDGDPIGDFHNVEAHFEDKTIELKKFDTYGEEEGNIFLSPKHACEFMNAIEEWLEIIGWEPPEEEEEEEEASEGGGLLFERPSTFSITVKDLENPSILEMEMEEESVKSLESVTEKIKEICK